MMNNEHRYLSAIRNCNLSGVLTWALFLLPFAFALQPLQAQTLTTLHAFTGPDGQQPAGDLYRDGAGNLYGTTPGGGSGNNGVIFKVTALGVESTLHAFSGADGTSPAPGLIHAAGGFFGTAYSGGASGDGVVFKLTGSVLTVLHSFSGPDGAHPAAAVIRDSAGNLYGTTFYGGTAACSCGTIFKVDSTGVETVLYSFTGGADGKFPAGRLVRDAAGNLYGTASEGGVVNCDNNTDGCGTVYKLTPTGTLTVLYTFGGTSDGGAPLAGLVRDGAGNLYGTTSFAGVMNSACSANRGCGTVFKVSKTGVFTLLYGFTGSSDGYRPLSDLARDTAGNLYGTTQYSGTGYGVIFKVSAAGAYSTLYGFTDGTDGGDPVAGLVRDSAGNLYGTGTIGGNPDFEEGVVFKLTP